MIQKTRVSPTIDPAPKLAWLAAGLVATCLAVPVQAAPDIEMAPRLTNEDFGPEQFPYDHAIAVPVGEAGFYPSGAVRVSQIDNLFYNTTADSEREATRLQVIPKFDLVAEGSKSLFWGVLRGDLRRHSGDDRVEDADTEDFRLRGFAHFDLDNRHRVDLELSHSQLSEELGTGRTRHLIGIDGAENTPDAYSLSRVGATYSYGNPRSRGELVGGLALGQLDYIENEDELSQYDRDMQILWGRFSYKLTGKTTLYTRVGHRTHRYDATQSERDKDTTSVTLGANWNSTGLLYGSAFVSFSDWEFVERDNGDGNDTTWGANLVWAIRSYSNANFYVREFIDDYTADSSIDTQKTSTLGVRWKHGWSERFNTTISAYNSVDEVDGDKTTERQVVSLEGRLSLRRWLNLLVGASLDELESTDQGLEADRTQLYVGLEGNL